LKNISDRNINAYKKDDIMIRIKGGNLSGKVQAITSKSMAHRQIICSALSNTETTLFIPDISDDIECTLFAVENLGIKLIKDGAYIRLSPTNKKSELFDCRESGTTLRFMLTIAPSLLEHCHFTGRGRLPERPINQIIDILRKSKCEVSSDKLPLTIKNKFEFTDVEIEANIFAAHLLIPDEEVIEMIRYGQSDQELANRLCVDINLLNLKISEMAKMNLLDIDVSKIERPKSDFLKNYQPLDDEWDIF